MDAGIFDHLDRGGEKTLTEFYENRLKLAEVYEQIGIHAYHVAEHHATPLGMSPSPNVFLAAMAQRTTHLRFGPVVYCLPLYHPVRLAQEICMLDQLSGGRLEMGVGRGISPIELGFYGLDYDDGPALYQESLALILKALTSDVLDFEGETWRVKDMPMEIRPVQQPHPPLWYGIFHPESADWTAANGVNVVTNQPADKIREITDRFRAAWMDAGEPGGRLPYMGMTRYMVIDEDGDRALAAARRAYPIWRKNFHALWDRNGLTPVNAYYAETFDGLMETGQGIAGTPGQVREEVLRQAEEAGVNYFLGRFAFGDLSFEEARCSTELFGAHVMPALKSVSAPSFH